ncbi:hypothetical protein L3Q82_015685, partial [Scortum barcoo]
MSHLMKALERIVLRHLRPLVSPNMDPLQFAYQPSIGVDDAIIYLLQRSLSHLEDAGNTVRITFFDFSSAFNTIHPSLLRVKLERAGASDQLAAWVTNYLTDRPQFVRLQDCVCPMWWSAAQLVPPREQSSHLSSSPCTHRTSRTPRTVATSRSSPMTLPLWDVCQRGTTLTLHQLNIQGLDIERVRTYKYLGVHLNNKLDWTDNTDSLYKKGQSRLYMLRRLGSFGVCRPLLRTFYETVVASVVSYAVVCWGGGCSERDKKRLNRLIKRASSVCGCQPPGLHRGAIIYLQQVDDGIIHPNAGLVCKLQGIHVWAHQGTEVPEDDPLQCLHQKQGVLRQDPNGGFLQPLLVPHRPWSHILLDFVMGLPTSKGCPRIPAAALPCQRRGGYGSLSPCLGEAVQENLGCCTADAPVGSGPDEDSSGSPSQTCARLHTWPKSPSVCTRPFTSARLSRFVHLVPPTKAPPLPKMVDSGPVYAVKKLLAVSKGGRGQQFLVDWEAYGPEERSWIPASFIVDHRLIEDFYHRHPETPGAGPKG